MNVWLIIGIVVGIIAVIMLIIGIYYWVSYSNAKPKKTITWWIYLLVILGALLLLAAIVVVIIALISASKPKTTLPKAVRREDIELGNINPDYPEGWTRPEYTYESNPRIHYSREYRS